jgi:hypothetical protein
LANPMTGTGFLPRTHIGGAAAGLVHPEQLR